MKAVALLLLVGVAVGTVRASSPVTQVFSEAGLSGINHIFDSYVSDLGSYGFDNMLRSVFQTGMWIYYENVSYNSYQPGKVYWVHGIEIAAAFPVAYSDMCSSLKYVGSPSEINYDTWTVYEGTLFTGSESYGSSSHSNTQKRGSSIILTGTSPWTFYDEEDWAGRSWCVFPNTDVDQGDGGEVFNLGIYPDVQEIGITDNSIASVKKGCWSKNVVKAEPLKAEHRGRNGAWGVLEP
ncbi:uncharacterized protein [Penaeus vannamei]|uniref:uncharacterized protein n=1 Tax=Penaeus vannamei TaxID=6689 RepID=UPI00387F4151